LTITGDLVPLDLVNDLRDRVRAWRSDGYIGATNVTRELFFRWFGDDREPGLRPFFAQQEAMETIVFLTEAPPDRRVGLEIPQAEAFERWCAKMVTGSGKTLVMAMTIAWSALNKAVSPADHRFADAFLVICPNLTVKERLAGLDPHRRPDNEYQSFDLIPPNYQPLLGQARVMVANWHVLAEDKDPPRSVLRRGRESDAAFCRRVLGTSLSSGGGPATEPERTLSRFGGGQTGGLGGLPALAGWTQLRSVLPVRPDRPVISASSMSPRRASAALPS
jgi:type III restriction enzyme